MGFVTSEKLTPSPLTIVSDLGKAIELERQMASGRHKTPLKDALNKCIADFNKMVTVKKHRVDSSRRALAYNLFLGLFLEVLFKHAQITFCTLCGIDFTL